MSFPRYPKYKESGVEWLGYVPEGWRIRALRHSMQLQNGQDYKDIETEVGGYPVYGSGGPFARATAFLYEGKSVLFGRKGTIDKPLYVEGKFWTVDTMYYTEVAAGVSPKFLYYFALVIPYDLFQYGTALPSMTQTTLHSIQMGLPPIDEQETIVEFLNQETAKIDALIEEQLRLIELLKEERQAVISRAVITGINPSVRVVDSGIDWIGKIPAHWQLKRLKHIKAKIPNAFVDGPFGSNLKSEHFVEDGDVFVIESNFATQGILDEQLLKRISAEHFETISRSEAKAGDIIIAKIGAQFGKSSLLPELSKRAVVSGNSLKLTVDAACCDVEWALAFLRISKDRGDIDLLSNGSAQPALSLGDLNNIPFLVPPVEEQCEIVRSLRAVVGCLDELASEALAAIKLLQERRAALISAAVTGKIDVRNYYAPQEVPAAAEEMYEPA